MGITYKVESFGFEVEVGAEALEGSDKQVSWGEDIREREVKGFLRDMYANPRLIAQWEAHPDKAQAMMGALRAVIASRPHAKSWIDSRHEQLRVAVRAQLGI